MAPKTAKELVSLSESAYTRLRPKPNIAALFAAHRKMKALPIAAHPTWVKLE